MGIMSSSKDKELSHEEWREDIIAKLNKIGISVPKDAVIEPPKKKYYGWNKDTTQRGPIQTPKEHPAPKDVPVVRKEKAERESYVSPFRSKTTVDGDLIKMSDGTLRVPLSWKDPAKKKENRKKIISAMNRVKWAVELLEKKDRRANSSLIASHKAVVLKLMECLN